METRVFRVRSSKILISDSQYTIQAFYGIGNQNGNPLQCSCLENPRDGGAWWAAVYGVAQSRTWLKWLSSSSSVLFSQVQFSSFTQSCWICVTLLTAARQASLSISNSQGLLKLMFIESVMPSNHLILRCPLLLPPSIFPGNQGDFQWVNSAWGGQSIGVLASASVLPTNIQELFPSEWTG